MKGKIINVLSLVLVVSLLSVGFVSAGWFGDMWGKITGNVILEDNLVAHYSFDGNAEDQSGNGNHAVLGGEVSRWGNNPNFNPNCNVSGILGTACLFDGNNDFISVPLEDRNQMTISTWIKTEVKNGCWVGIVSSHISFQNSGHFLISNCGENGAASISSLNGKSRDLEGVKSLADSLWHNIVFVSSNASSKLYVDGVLEDTLQGSVVSGGNEMVIGVGEINNPTGYNFQGLIDEIKIYDVALADSDVLELYESVVGSVVNVTCTDSDGGYDYFTKGTVTIGNESRDDHCIGSNSLLENACCPGGGFCAHGGITCEHGCVDGACVVESENITCTDSDGGLDYYEKGEIRYFYNVHTENPDFYGWHEASDNCAFDGTKVLEYGCKYYSPEEMHPSRNYDCPNGCSDGACNEVTHGSCEEHKLRAGAFRLDGSIEEFDLDVYDGSSGDGWTILCSSLREEDDCYYKNVQLKVLDISKSFKDGVSNKVILEILDGGVFYNQNTLLVGSIYEFEEDKEDYVVAKWCDGGNIGTCQSAIDFMSTPTNLTIEGTDWELRYNDSWSYFKGDEYWASFYNRDNYGYDYAYVNLEILNSESYTSVEKRLENALEYGLCQQERIYNYEGGADDFQVVYICRNMWDLANDAQEVLEEKWSDEMRLETIWINDNKLIRINTHSIEYRNSDCYDYESCIEQENRRHREQQVDIAETLGRLIDNEAEYVGGFYLSGEVRGFVEHFLNMCGSKINESAEYAGSWQCKLEPVICPPHGEQTEVCTRYNSNLEERESREVNIQCNPGICSGCMVPRWFGSVGDNTCIPYGIRFEQKEVVDVDEASEGQDNGYDTLLNITNDYSAYFKFGEGDSSGNWEYVAFEGMVYEGNTYSFSEDYSGQTYQFRVQNIFSSGEDSNPRIVVEFIDQMDAYCDIDGKIKPQKDNSLGSDWVKCQNNYECASNICSYGECVDLRGLVNEAKGIRAFFVKIGCKFRNLFDSDNYAQCLYDNLGEETQGSNSSNSSSGGSGNSSNLDG